MRTFTKIREMLATNRELREKIEKLEKKYDKKFANCIKHGSLGQTTKFKLQRSNYKVHGVKLKGSLLPNHFNDYNTVFFSILIFA